MIKIETKICPNCKNKSLDYDPDLRKLVCVWESCNYESNLICKCGKEIPITVPMYVNKSDEYICKECFDKIKNPKSFVIIDGFTYEIGIPIDTECPTSSLCNGCTWNQPYFSNRKICIFPKVLYGNLDAYNEYQEGKIGIKELIEKYGRRD